MCVCVDSVRLRSFLWLIGIFLCGSQPTTACERALRRIAKFYPDFLGAMVCLNRRGEYGAAGHGWSFSYSVQTEGMHQPVIVDVPPMK